MTTFPSEPKAIRLRANFRADAFAIIHRSSKTTDPPWRISFFDELGPVGHTHRRTVAELVRLAVADGYCLLDEVRL